jgi:hypothetical protein
VIGRSYSAAICAAITVATGCGGTLDAGRDVPHGALPVDERNAVIIENDSASDNWMGEYAVLLANDGVSRLAGIIICASNYWPDLNANVSGWTNLVNAARASSLAGIPDLTASAGAPLTKPSDGHIDSTVPNRSLGAQRIIELSSSMSLPTRPLVVLVGTQLTDLADAYLVDPTVVDRVVVIASLGSLKTPKALMTGPNGDLDPWADWIVAQRFRYVQISSYYDQTADVTMAELGNLPKNPFGNWIAQKQPKISSLPQAADQVAVLAAGVPDFVVAAQRSSPDLSAGFGSPPGQGPPLVPDQSGRDYFVTQIAAPLAASRFWKMLLEPSMNGQ